jgi:hypothetical protein
VKERRAVHFLTDLQGVFECKSCLAQISTPEMKMTHPSIRHGNAERMADRLRYADRLRASGDGFNEFPTLGQR